MSRAFVKEDDGSRPETLLDLSVSSAPNLVTARGLRQITARVSGLEAALEAARAAGEEDPGHIARLRRDLRYWALRHATARLTVPDPSIPGVQFGSRVAWAAEDGSRRTATITGEDEADPAAGTIPWTAPVARALMGAVPGDTVTVVLRGTPADLEVLAVDVPGDSPPDTA